MPSTAQQPWMKAVPMWKKTIKSTSEIEVINLFDVDIFSLPLTPTKKNFNTVWRVEKWNCERCTTSAHISFDPHRSHHHCHRVESFFTFFSLSTLINRPTAGCDCCEGVVHPHRKFSSRCHKLTSRNVCTDELVDSTWQKKNFPLFQWEFCLFDVDAVHFSHHRTARVKRFTKWRRGTQKKVYCFSFSFWRECERGASRQSAITWRSQIIFYSTPLFSTFFVASYFSAFFTFSGSIFSTHRTNN